VSPSRAGKARFAIWTCLAIAALPSTARADDEQELAGLLNETVVSGPSKNAEVASDAPATTSTITAADIHRYGIRSLDEAINFLGMGFVTQNPLHSVDIGGRGVMLTADFGNHVLLVVDGHVMNEPWDGTAYFEQGAAIPMELIDHIELVLGPGSVLYGGNAMIGVVNVVTKRAASYKGIHAVAEGSVSPAQGKGGSVTSFAPSDLGTGYRLGVGTGQEFTLLGKAAEFTGQADFYSQNGPSFEWGPQTENNPDGTPTNFGPRTPLGVWGGRTFRQYSTTVPQILARLSVGDLSIWVHAAQYQRSTPYINGFNQTLSDFDEPRSYERDQWASVDVQYRAHLARGFVLKTHAYADAYAYDQPVYVSQGSECAGAPAGACIQTSRGRSDWGGGELQAQYDWTGDDRLTTMLGLDARLRHVGGETDSLAVDTGTDLGAVGRRYVLEPVLAAYVQQRYSPIAPLHLNGGIRFDTDPRGGDRFSPRVAAAFDTWPGGVVKAIYSEAFRAPTFYEAYYESPQQHPSPDIHSEVVRGVESSVEQKVGPHRFLMGVFATRWSDMISLEVDASGLYQYRNVSSIDSYGYNARAEGAFGVLRYGLSVTGAHTRRNAPDGAEPLAAAPQLYGNFRLSYDLPDALPVVALAATFVGSRPADRALDGNFATTPYAPTSLELRATLSERVPGLPALSYRFGGSFVSASQSPYVAGPTQIVDPNAAIRPQAELAPINRYTAFGTLQYDWP
jgi:outer membrane cobalamin receptor